MLTCRWCGETYKDNEPLDRIENGFWCDVCDGFTYHDATERGKCRFLLLLEDKGKADPQTSPSSLPHLKKRLSPLRYPGGKSKLIDYLSVFQTI